MRLLGLMIAALLSMAIWMPPGSGASAPLAACLDASGVSADRVSWSALSPADHEPSGYGDSVQEEESVGDGGIRMPWQGITNGPPRDDRPVAAGAPGGTLARAPPTRGVVLP